MAESDLLPPSADPNVRKLGIRAVRGRNDAGTKTVLNVRDFPEFATDEPDTLGGTNSGPSPLETVLAALVGCDGVIIHGVAKAMGFAYTGVDFDCSGQVDLRGPKGVPGIRPYFEKIRMSIVVHTDETPQRFEQLKKNVEFRCPVMNLMRAASVELSVDWIARPVAKRQAAE